jgi:hypothetical protein
MAEIKVEQKRSGLGWLWTIIVLALVGVAAWYFMTQRAVPATTTPADSTRTSMVEIPTLHGTLTIASEATVHG